jgi:glucose/arabinose dehydrogenase
MDATDGGASFRARVPMWAGGGGVQVTEPARRLPLALLAATAVAAVAACTAPSGQPQATAPATAAAAASSSPAPASTSPSVSAADRAASADSSTTLVVPAGEGAGALSAPRQLTVPSGWTARVWARVDDARMEAWTPEGDLLVTSPGDGSVMELRPDAAGTATVTTLLTGLTNPQGLAFARLGGRWVLYVAESDQIDRYPWGPGGVGGPRTVIAGGLPDQDPNGDDVHRPKDVAVAADGTVYFNVGSSSNANPDDRTMTPPRAVIMSVRPDGTGLRVVERGVRNGEGLAVAPNGAVWTAVNERDNIPYPSHRAYGTYGDAFGLVIQAYVNEHPSDEVVPVTPGRDLGWPYCDPDQDDSSQAGSLADVPLVANATTNPNGTALDCAKLAPIEVGLPAHSAPLGMSFLEGSKLPAPWSGGAVIAVHGSWDRHPPRAPAVEWLAWDAAEGTLTPAVTLVGGFELPNGSYWGRPADAVPGPDGALYVSDDTTGAIYRLTPPS